MKNGGVRRSGAGVTKCAPEASILFLFQFWQTKLGQINACLHSMPSLHAWTRARLSIGHGHGNSAYVLVALDVDGFIHFIGPFKHADGFFRLK